MTFADEGYEQDIAKGGVACPFPWRLHEMLKVTAEEGLQDIVSWSPHGRAFTVHKPKDFADRVLTRFFSQTKYPSFQRQLNLYGFSRFAHGTDKGAYYHFCFVKGHEQLVRNMVRTKVKGTKVRRTPTEEPNFYDPAWKSHFGASIPDHLKQTAFNSVAPPAPAKKTVAPRATPDKKACVSPSTVVPSAPSYVDILPAPQLPNFVPVSDEESSQESLDTLDIEALDSQLLTFEGNPFHYLELDFSSSDLDAVISQDFPAFVAM